MSKKEIKKELKKKLEVVTDFNIKLNASLESIVEDYIKYISENIDNCYMKYFGVGITVSTNQFGSYYGFINERMSYERGFDIYTCTGNGYHVAGDYNYYINGSNQKDLIAFAKQIPIFVEQGIKHIKAKNIEMQNIENTLKSLLNNK